MSDPAALSDPMEQIIQEALRASNIRYQTGAGGGTEHGLDFHLPDYDVAIEVKRFHSERIADQMSRFTNVIAVQGEVAVNLLADIIRALPSPPQPC